MWVAMVRGPHWPTDVPATIRPARSSIFGPSAASRIGVAGAAMFSSACVVSWVPSTLATSPASNGSMPSMNSRVNASGWSHGSPIVEATAPRDCAPMPRVNRPPSALWAVRAACARPSG